MLPAWNKLPSRIAIQHSGDMARPQPSQAWHSQWRVSSPSLRCSSLLRKMPAWLCLKLVYPTNHKQTNPMFFHRLITISDDFGVSPRLKPTWIHHGSQGDIENPDQIGTVTNRGYMSISLLCMASLFDSFCLLINQVSNQTPLIVSCIQMKQFGDALTNFESLRQRPEHDTSRSARVKWYTDIYWFPSSRFQHIPYIPDLSLIYKYHTHTQVWFRSHYPSRSNIFHPRP